MAGVITAFTIILSIIAVGYSLSKFGIIGNDSQRLVLNKTAFYAATPCLLFSSLATSDPQTLFSPVLAAVVASSLLTGASYIIASRLFFPKDVPTTTMGAASSFYFNSVNIGLPVSIYVVGEASWVISILMLQMVFFTPFILAALSDGHGRTRSAKVFDGIRSGFSSPLVFAGIGGMVVALTGLEIPEVVLEPISIIGGASIPMILISFGASLTSIHILDDPADRPAVITATAMKLVLMPLFAWLAGMALGLSNEHLYVAVILACLPTAQNVYNYAATYQKGLAVTRDTVFLTTFASLPVMAVVAGIFGS